MLQLKEIATLEYRLVNEINSLIDGLEDARISNDMKRYRYIEKSISALEDKRDKIHSNIN